MKRFSSYSDANESAATGRTRRYAAAIVVLITGVVGVATFLMMSPGTKASATSTAATTMVTASPRPTTAAVAPITAPIPVAPITAPTTVAPTPATTVAPVPTPVSTSAVPATTVAPPAPATTVVVAPVTVATAADECTVALAYLAAHANKGFAFYCRPGPLNVGVAHTVAYTCVPGTGFSCPDGGPEIIIADPACAISYENEASNSFWDFSSAGAISAGSVQNGRTWDPYGECP